MKVGAGVWGGGYLALNFWMVFATPLAFTGPAIMALLGALAGYLIAKRNPSTIVCTLLGGLLGSLGGVAAGAIVASATGLLLGLVMRVLSGITAALVGGFGGYFTANAAYGDL